jgi:hypothetical protein
MGQRIDMKQLFTLTAAVRGCLGAVPADMDGLAASIRRWLPPVMLLFGGLLVFCLAYFSPVSNDRSDPRFTLLVSQALVEHGTIRLDAYADVVQPRLDEPENAWVIVRQDGHFYNYFPIGPSLFSAPAVWAVNLLDKDMANPWHSRPMQNILSALLCLATFLLLFSLCREYVGWGASLVISLVSMLGSSLISTMGTALWNIDFAVFFATLALLLIVRLDHGRARPWEPFLIGFLLFCIYISRPSASTFIIVALAYLLWRHRDRFLRVAITALVPLLLFSLWSWWEFGSLAPIYYAAAARFQAHASSPWLALYGHLLSPSRGLFVFSPFVVLVLAGVIWRFKRLAKRPMIWFAMAWFVLAIAAASTMTRWWGGWSFGSRILTEGLPAVVLLTALLWQDISEGLSRTRRRIVIAGYLTLGMLGILINSYQGLYNLNTAAWNGTMLPDVDREPSYLFDWRYPQFLASSGALCAKNREYVLRTAAEPSEVAWGEVIGHRESDARVVFIGWSQPEAQWRWSDCTSAALRIRLGAVDPQGTYHLQIAAGSYGAQNVAVYVNGAHAGDLTFPGPPTPPAERSLIIPGSLLKADAVNEIRFEIPGAVFPDNGDPRLVGLAFTQLRLDPIK